jgi:hypothetical protein
MAQAITLGARRALLLKRVVLGGAAFTAMAWAGASWYAEQSAAPGTIAVIAPAPVDADGETPATEAGFALRLRLADALQTRPAGR